MNSFIALTVFLPLLLLHQAAGYVSASSDMGDLLQKSSSLERQLQFEGQKLQNLANGLARKNVFQVGAANRQTQITQAMESVAGNIFAMKGLSDLNSIERLGLSSDVRQCYLLNNFSFGDAINTAKSTAMQCISEKFNEGKAIADNAINDIQSAAQNVSGAAQMIAQCREYTVSFPSGAGLVARVACLSQAVLMMKSSAILLPINLGLRATQANAAIATIQSDIIKCNLNILSEIVTQSTNAGQAIAECISQSSTTTSQSTTTTAAA